MRSYKRPNLYRSIAVNISMIKYYMIIVFRVL